MSEGAARITDERFRQVEKEGWAPEHDEAHVGGELAAAALCHLREYVEPRRDAFGPPKDWPWDASFWRPGHGEVRRLEIAGALIAAEIDRLLGHEFSTRDGR